MSRRPLLLDTCALIWIAEGAPLREPGLAELRAALDEEGRVCVSPISAWEIGMLVSKGRLAIRTTPRRWFEAAAALPGLSLAELTPAILAESSALPGVPPRDPADRIMAATAREADYTLVTRDGPLLAYAAAGHVAAIEC